MTDTRIFVFGSNLAGVHGKGAALYAYQQHGAVYGNGIGPMGTSYAIPTKDAKLRTLPLDAIRPHVADFLNYARLHPKLRFNVTRIGCGLAGYTDADIAPMFRHAPYNCDLPEGWRPADAPITSEWKPEPPTTLAEELKPCAVCGKPVLWGTRCPPCGQRVMAAESLSLDELKRIVREKEAVAAGATERMKDRRDWCTDPSNCRRCKAATWDQVNHEHAGIPLGTQRTAGVATDQTENKHG